MAINFLHLTAYLREILKTGTFANTADPVLAA